MPPLAVPLLEDSDYAQLILKLRRAFLDSAGRLIGVNTAIFSPSGSNAGLASGTGRYVNRIVPQLIRQGEITCPGLGVRIGDDRFTLTKLLGADYRGR
jgi:2-alkenal reductase